MGPKEIRKTDPFIHYGVGAAKQALKDSGIEVTDANRERIGILVGSGIGGIGSIEEQCVILNTKGPKRVSPFFVPSSIINMISGYISIDTGITGPNLAVVTACTTATHAIGLAGRLIASGDADLFLAGASEAGSAPSGMAGFCAARALSTRNDAPEKASRPWDKDRDGFVVGEGAGILILEELEHAKARGANILAEIVGYGMSGDAYHITSPAPEHEGAYRVMLNAIRDAKIQPGDIGYVNAHGTSTDIGDKLESVAIKRAFADKIPPVSSTKSMTGHLLGGAGGLEAGITVLALRDQIVPPTINYETPDPECDLDYVPNQARKI